MAESNKPKIRATELAGLEAYANQVFEGSQGNYTLDDFEYMDDTSLFSQGCFTVVNGGAVDGLTLLAGTEIDLFTTPAGQQSGQGWPAALKPTFTLAETNLQKGFSGGKAPANQAYSAVALGFNVYCIPSDEAGTAWTQRGGIPVPSANDLHQIVNSICWTWNVGGSQSPTIQYEPLVAWPAGFGITGIGAVGAVQAMANGGAGSSMRKIPFPLMFPPMIAAEFKLTVRRAPTNFESLAAGTLVVVSAHMRGYMVSKVR